MTDPLSALASRYPGTDKAAWGHNYLPVYELLFRGKERSVSCVLEIGVADGSSLQLWRDHFPNAQVYGIEKLDRPYNLGPRITVVRGDVRDVVLPPGPFDLVVDDGSHRMEDVQHAYVRLWPRMRPGGYYVIEDADLMLGSIDGGDRLAVMRA